nr:integrase, catalytic region, zinc finger, CCHC-type, peptidase aspartic, catalytic [Tanacetum cinerariifolium]
MDIFTKGALWEYWKWVVMKLRYLIVNLLILKNTRVINPDLLTKDTIGFKTYEDYKDEWIYEWNENVPWVCDNPWLDKGIWKEPTPVKYTFKMSRDVITVGSTIRIPLLYRGEYSQWRERTVQNATPILKDPKLWTAEEKKTRKIDHLARSLLIKGILNNIYSLIDSNKTAKDLWDALERQMCGSEYVNKIGKLQFYMMINDLNKCGYKKDNYELNYKFLNNLQPEWKQYGTLMRQTKNLMDINIDAPYNILKQNQVDVNDALGCKKRVVVVTSDPLALVAEKTKVTKRKEKVIVQSESEGSDDDDIGDLKKITALLAKAFNRKKCYAKPTNNNLRTSSASSSANKKPKYEINVNMVFMAKMENVLSDSDKSSSSVEETIAEVAYYTSESESESEYETSEYYDNSTNYGLFVNDNDDQEIFHDAIESASQNFIENHIDSQKNYDKSEVDHNDSEEKDHLVEKLIRKFNHKIAKCHKRIEKENQQTKDLEIQNKDLQYKLYDSFDENNLFIFDDESVRNSQVSKMPFRKKPNASLKVPSRSKLNKSSPRIVRKWLPKLQPLAKPIDKWILKIVQICLWIIDSGCSKHMTGNRAPLTNFVEKFLGTVRFGNNNFAVIPGYGDVVIGSMTIKKFTMSKVYDITYLALDNFMTRALKSPFESLYVLFETKMV